MWFVQWRFCPGVCPRGRFALYPDNYDTHGEGGAVDRGGVCPKGVITEGFCLKGGFVLGFCSRGFCPIP